MTFNVVFEGVVIETVDWDGLGELPAALQRANCTIEPTVRDPFVPVPAGVRVHHWPELVGWVGSHKMFAPENGGGPHHECYYVIADDEVALNNLAAWPNVNFEIGQPAYLKDKKLLVTWDGTKWK